MSLGEEVINYEATAQIGGEENVIVNFVNGKVFCDCCDALDTSGLYLMFGDFVIDIITKSGRIVGIRGSIESINYELASCSIPKNFIDGDVLIFADQNFLKNLSFAYNFPRHAVYDQSSNLLRLGDDAEGDLTVRIFKNMYVSLNDGNVTGITIDGKICK